MEHDRLLEVCVDNFDSAHIAASKGASRLEVCSSLSEGGLTPSPGLVAFIKKKIPYVTVSVMIRCNSSPNFVYSDTDIHVMLEDIKALKTLEVDGFVFGSLNEDGSLNENDCKRIISAANPIPVTFHRAFDVCSEPFVTLEKLISIGFKRILTSGRQPSVATSEGCTFVKDLIARADNRIVIMPGSGVNPENVLKVLDTGACEIHASCLTKGEKVDSSGVFGKKDKEHVYKINEAYVAKIASVLKNYDSF